MEEALKRIINHYGIMKQLKYIHSEYYELDEAIINAENNRNVGITRGICASCIKHIAEELADVMVMLEQFRLNYGISEDYIAQIAQYKVERQLKRIEEENEKEQ